MIPFFCQGKDTQAATSGPLGLGTRTIPVTNAGALLHPGERLFINDPGGGPCEYLGRVHSVQVDSATVEFATGRTRAAGANVWTPALEFEWPAGPEVTVRRARHGGVELVRSLGGTAWSTRLESPHETEAVAFELSEDRFARFASWCEQTANDGLTDFTYVDSSRSASSVRLEIPTLEWSRTARGLIAVSFKLHLLIEGEYV